MIELLMNCIKGITILINHIRILIVSKPGYALRNHIKDYIDRN